MMRLTTTQKNIIRSTIETVLDDPMVEIGVFGSRLDTSARGGDIDLVVRTKVPVPIPIRARIRLRLETQLGLPVDLVFVSGDVYRTAFQAMVSAKAQPMDGVTR